MICKNEKSRTKRLLANNIIVDNALTIGEAPARITAKIYNGNVCIDAPAQKNEIIKSSKEIINTKRPDAINAGAKRGTTIAKKVCRFVAPRSYDASIKLTSKSAKRACKIGTTYPKPSNVCPAINVAAPSGTAKKENKESNPTVSTISGIAKLP